MHVSVVVALWAFCTYIVWKVARVVANEYWVRSEMRRLKTERPPYLRPHDFNGFQNMRDLMKADKENSLNQMIQDVTLKAMNDNGNKTATFYRQFFGAKFIFTVDPKVIQTILATKFKQFDLGPVRRDSFRPLLERGIFANDGKGWEHSRAMLRPQFVRDQVSDLDLEERHVHELLQALPVKEDGWTEVTNLLPLFFRLTLDSATEFLFGESVGSQLANLPGAVSKAAANDLNFAVSFDKAQNKISKAVRLAELYWLAYNKDFRDNCGNCHKFIDYYVKRALRRKHNPDKEKTAESTDGKPKYVFLDALAETTDDPVELRQELLNILLAGRDTTASLLSFLFVEFDRNPHVYKKLRSIILEEFGTFKNPRNITFARLKACSYLQWVLNEGLRLYPIVPVNSRVANEDTTLPTGGGPDGQSPIYIRKNMTVEYSVFVMHRRKDIWGEDAEDFKPERWDGKKYGFEYLPFNGGPRICIGQQFALTEAGYVLVRMLQKFEECVGVGNSWEPVEKGGVGWVKCYLTLTMSPADGVKIKLKEAKED